MHFWPQSCLRLVESPSMLSRCSLVSFVLPTNVTRLHHINYISATRDANSNVPERQDDDDTDPRSNYISFLFSSSLRFFLQHYWRNSFRCWNYLCTNHFEIFISEKGYSFKRILIKMTFAHVFLFSISLKYFFLSIFSWVTVHSGIERILRKFWGQVRVFFSNRIILRGNDFHFVSESFILKDIFYTRCILEGRSNVVSF